MDSRLRSDLDHRLMQQAIELAQRGEGAVEPNPMVGCVIARGAEVVGQGWHQGYGKQHAEIEALMDCGDEDLSGATVYVTLEPCSHHGKTPPCADAVINSGARRVVIAQQDPFHEVAGRGLQQLREAGLIVEVGVGEAEARQLNAPYLKLVQQQRPWVLAKWASTLDGKIATSMGDSQWISSEESRAIVHQLRGRVDAIMVGVGTALADDPLLVARPSGPRTATRIVVDSTARLRVSSRLVRTARETPVIVAVGPAADLASVRRLEAAGVEIYASQQANHVDRLLDLLDELGRRRMTNLLVEGGSHVLGSLLDAQQIDEVHAFVAPKLVGGSAATPVISGKGITTIQDAVEISDWHVTQVGGDLYIQGRTAK